MASLFRSSVLALSRGVQTTAIRRTPIPAHISIPIRSFSLSTPALVKKYTEDHEWIDLPEGSDIGTMGITDYAAHALGDVVFVELPTVDRDVSKGESMGAVESVKSASDIMTPVTGKIVEINSSLEEKPATINKDPEGEAWFAMIQIADKAELDGLMDAEAYKRHTEEASAAQ